MCMCAVLYRILLEKRCIHSEIEDTFLFRRCSQIFERTSVVGINSMRACNTRAAQGRRVCGKDEARYDGCYKEVLIDSSNVSQVVIHSLILDSTVGPAYCMRTTSVVLSRSHNTQSYDYRKRHV